MSGEPEGSGDSRIPADWTRRADLNADAGRVLLEAGRWPLGACERAQQAVEMSLKAALIHHLGGHPFIHDLAALYRRLPETARESIGSRLGLSRDALKTRLDILSEWWLDKYPWAAGQSKPPPTLEEEAAEVALAE